MIDERSPILIRVDGFLSGLMIPTWRRLAVALPVTAVIILVAALSSHNPSPELVLVEKRMTAADPSRVHVPYDCVVRAEPGVYDVYQCTAGDGRCNGQDIYNAVSDPEPATFYYRKLIQPTSGKDC
jgi:hypothetical protein